MDDELDFEVCQLCGDPTGNLEEGEDSLYLWKQGVERIGPFCKGCYDHLRD